MHKKNANIKIDRLKRTKGFEMPALHYHNRYEIYYLLSGEIVYFIKDRIYHIQKGDVVLINANDLHKTSSVGQEDHERILIEFNRDFLANYLANIDDLNPFSCFKQKNNLIKLNIEEQAWIENLLFNIIRENKKQKLGYNSAIKLLLLQLLISLNRYNEQLNQEIIYLDKIHSTISDIARYLNKNFDENITLNSLAERFSISPYHLSRTFKNTTGFNFVEFLNNVRIKEAQRLLRKTNLNITEISNKSGYNSLTHFGRIFKSNTGLSPSKYRKLERYNN